MKRTRKPRKTRKTRKRIIRAVRKPKPPPPQVPKPPQPSPPPPAKNTTETHALAAYADLTYFDKLPVEIRRAINGACWKMSSEAIFDFWTGGMTVGDVIKNIDKFNREHGGAVRP